jgi:hypothetical protein
LPIPTIISIGLNVYLATRNVSAKKSSLRVVEPQRPTSLHYLREQINSKHLIEPLLLIDDSAESPKLAPLKWELTRTIQEWQKD